MSQTGFAWLLMAAAGCLEVVWAFGMKQSEGFTRLWPTLLMIVAITGSVTCMTLAFRHVPLGTGYAVWVGIGAAGSAVVGILMFGESADWMRLASIGLIVAGVIGLKLGSAG
jgi:quaternary ammonium compound-resistance protein SugE